MTYHLCEFGPLLPKFGHNDVTLGVKNYTSENLSHILILHPQISLGTSFKAFRLTCCEDMEMGRFWNKLGK